MKVKIVLVDRGGTERSTHERHTRNNNDHNNNARSPCDNMGQSQCGVSEILGVCFCVLHSSHREDASCSLRFCEGSLLRSFSRYWECVSGVTP